MIVREFDLDDALGGVISAVELFQIPSPEGDYSSLVTFRDKAQHVLTQLPIAERPSDAMLSKWLYERLKKVRSFSIIIDRIKESVAGSNERTFDYLWSRLMRHIAEQQHDKNLSSTQEDLRKGPRKTTSGATAKPEPKAKSKVETPDASGAVAKGKGKGKGKGKTKSAPNTTKPPDSKNPGGTSTSQCSVAHWTSLAVKKYNLFAFETLCGRQTKGWAIHWDACQTEVALGHLGLSFSAVSTSLWKPNHKEVL